VAAFYSLPRRLFYTLASLVCRHGFTFLLYCLNIRSQVEAIIHRASEVLLAAQIPLGRLHRRMSQQELNLLQLASAVMAQFRAGSPQIVWRYVLQAGLLAAASDHVPNNVLR
jgi:hypothetical protein